MADKTCAKCGAPLTRDDIGAHRKLVHRGAQSFYCKACLAAHFHISPAYIDEMIARFRSQGCRLFR